MEVHQKAFPFGDFGIAILEVYPAGADGLDLATREGYSRLQLLDHVILKESAFIADRLHNPISLTIFSFQ